MSELGADCPISTYDYTGRVACIIIEFPLHYLLHIAFLFAF